MKMSNDVSFDLEKFVTHEDNNCFFRLEENNIINVFKNCFDDKQLYNNCVGSIYFDLNFINHLILIVQQFRDEKSIKIWKSLIDIKYFIENLNVDKKGYENEQ